MSNNRFKMIASVYLLYIRDEKILLLRRQNTGYNDGMYVLPAGHVEENETIPSAMIREAKEEAGLSLALTDLKLVHVMHRKEEDERMDFFFLSNNTSEEPRNAEPEKCDDIGWFALNELPDNTIPFIKQGITNYLQHALYSEIGW